MIDDNHVREGSLVEVEAGPLRIADDSHNFGIVSCMKRVSGFLYAEVVTNTGKHRLIEPNRLCVLSQSLETEDADADSDRGQHPTPPYHVGT